MLADLVVVLDCFVVVCVVDSVDFVYFEMEYLVVVVGLGTAVVGVDFGTVVDFDLETGAVDFVDFETVVVEQSLEHCSYS